MPMPTRRTLLAAALLAAGAFLLGSNDPARAAENPYVLDAVPAPELTGGPWLNTPKGAPIRVSGKRGRVTIVHYWTFG
jgi:hypothetical protein